MYVELLVIFYIFSFFRFQELDLSAETLIKNITPREDEWLKVTEKGLHPKAQYTKVMAATMSRSKVVETLSKKVLGTDVHFLTRTSREFFKILIEPSPQFNLVLLQSSIFVELNK